MTVNLVPLTTEEMNEIQSTVVDRMIELNREIREGKHPEQALQEISKLSKLSNKISNYQYPK
jgi:hypothetical protein